MGSKINSKDNSVNFHGEPVRLYGELPKVGSTMVSYALVKTDLSTLYLDDVTGKVLYNIFPSVDTGVCAKAMIEFHTRITNIFNVSLVCVSADLPFAQKRFCATEGLENAKNASCFRDGGAFGKATGLLMTSGPLKGLLARAVIITDAGGTIIYTELVPEVTQEPNYEKAIAVFE